MAFSAVRGNVGWVHPEDATGTLICWAMSAGVVIVGVAWRGDLRKMRLDVQWIERLEEGTFFGCDGCSNRRIPCFSEIRIFC